MASGKRRVAADIEAARPAAAAKPTGGAPPPPPPPEFLTSRFKVEADGVWMERRDEKARLWLCPRLEAIAETEDDDGYFGMLWAWRDRFGRERQEVFARESFTGEASEVLRAMAARGLTANPQRDAKQGFVEYLALASSTVRARVVSRPGWHKIGGALVYVQSDGSVIGRPPLRVILQHSSRDINLFQQQGTIEEWTNAIGQKCIGNSRLVLAVSMAFAPALLLHAGEDGGGINLVGDSRSGKSTAGLCSVSVYGGDPAAGGARAAMRTWRLTSNSTEAIAATHSDKGLVLDELGQVEGREIGSVAYMLASGQGKGRMDRGATLRAALTWRVMFLSTGELTLAAKIAEAGIGTKVRAGQQVRLLDLPADAGAGMGVFSDIHDADNAGAFAQELKDATGAYFGTAFPAFIQHIVDRVERDPVGFGEYVRDEINRLATAWMALAGAQSGQVGTPARRFALIAVAGNLASDAKITGWGRVEGRETEAEWAAKTCFLAWLSDRGTIGNLEDAQAVVQLREFVSRHGNARFEVWQEREPDPADQTVDAKHDAQARPPVERRVTMNRAGWRKWRDGEWVYLFTKDAMHEATTGLSFKAAVKMLAARGLIEAGPREIAQPLTPPGAKKQRLYVVPSAVMSATAAVTRDEEDA